MEELGKMDNELIFNHINGTLTDAERLLFDQRCQENPAFRAEVVAYEDAKKAAFIGGQSKIKDILKDEAAQYNAEQGQAKKVKIVPLWTWILRGVAASLVVGMGLWAIRYFEKPNTEELFLKHFSPLKNDIVTIFRGEDSILIEESFRLRHDTAYLKLAQKALLLYSENNYTKSILAFNQINELEDSLLLFKSNAYLALDSTTQALNLLTKLTAQSKGDTKGFSEWYLALIYLKQQRIPECQALLKNVIASPPNQKYLELAEVLQQALK